MLTFERPGGEPCPGPGVQPPAIETRELTKRYGSARGIEALTLSVETGEIFGFLGANGAGKTTLIRTLLDLQRPTAGSARLFGLDSRRDSLAIRARVGNLPGGFAFDEAVTGRRLMRYLAGLRGMRDLGRADELARRFNADLDRPLGHLSRGNRQKIGLIQAMFHVPELLILDEPTSGLDPLVQETFLELADEERAVGRTVFLSSHNLAEVQRICDRVAIIKEGRLLAVDTVAELTRRAQREVTITFGDAAEPQLFESIPGVRDLHVVRPDTLRFLVGGEIDPVLRAAAAHHVVDIAIEPPDLEDAFLAYYGDEAGA